MSRLERPLLVAALVLLAIVIPALAAGYVVVDRELLYHGTATTPKTPAAVQADLVFIEISEYRTIIEEELTDNDPTYYFLLKRATDRFVAALAAVAKADGYDVIGEVGSIKAEDADRVPEVTKAVVQRVD